MNELVKNKKHETEPFSFSDKIPFIRSLILNTVNNEILEKVYLFGSYAYGQPDKDSDIDICVVVNNGQERFRIAGDISSVLHDNKITPLDILVFRHDDFYNAKNPQGIQRTIMEKGRLLYG